MSLTLQSKSVTAYGETYRPRKEKILDITLDIQQERTGVKVKYDEKTETAFILMNPKPYEHDHRLCADIVASIFMINRSQYRRVTP